MRIGRSVFIALAVCTGGALCSSQVLAQLPYTVTTGSAERIWTPPPQPYVPGPGWFADDPPPGSNPAHYDLDASASDWNVAYPYKYFPQGGLVAATDGSEYEFLPKGPPGSCFCSPPPCYFGTIFLNVVVFERGNVSSHNVIFDSVGNPALGTDSLNLPTEAGLHGGLILASPHGNDWIIEYLGVNDSQATATVTGTDLGFFFFGAPSVAAVATTYTLDYESSLDSAEFTVRSRLGSRLAMLAGFRYVGLHEDFNVLDSVDPFQPAVVSETTNDLFGFQFGFQSMIWQHNQWQVETTAKAGAYYNDLDVDATDGITTFTASGSHVAFVGDLRAGVTYRLGPLVVFRVGYQALWLEGVALAPDQSAAMSLTYNRGDFDLSRVVYHGGYLGFQLSW